MVSNLEPKARQNNRRIPQFAKRPTIADTQNQVRHSDFTLEPKISTGWKMICFPNVFPVIIMYFYPWIETPSYTYFAFCDVKVWDEKVKIRKQADLYE